MPHSPELRKFYGHRWRTVTRPRILQRAGKSCERCGKFWHKLEVAHLEIPPGEPGHDDDDNLAALCIPCHRRHDYPEWARKCRETRAKRKDRNRPLLVAMTAEVS